MSVYILLGRSLGETGMHRLLRFPLLLITTHIQQTNDSLYLHLECIFEIKTKISNRHVCLIEIDIHMTFHVNLQSPPTDLYFA